MKRSITQLLFLFFTCSIQAQEKDSLKNIDDNIKTSHTIWYAGIHFAGNTGLSSINAGPSLFNDHLDLRLGYGYLPKFINDAEVHCIHFKTTYYFSRGIFYKKAKWYIGCNTIYAFASNTFVKLPTYYPDDYYTQTALHWAPYIGVRVPFIFYKPGWAENSYLHLEVGTLDNYVWYKMNNNEIKIWDIYNVSAGLSFGF